MQGRRAASSPEGERLLVQALDGKAVRGASMYGELVHRVGLVRHACGLVHSPALSSKKCIGRRETFWVQ